VLSGTGGDQAYETNYDQKSKYGNQCNAAAAHDVTFGREP
jgi:hypothetical protein